MPAGRSPETQLLPPSERPTDRQTVSPPSRPLPPSFHPRSSLLAEPLRRRRRGRGGGESPALFRSSDDRRYTATRTRAVVNGHLPPPPKICHSDTCLLKTTTRNGKGLGFWLGLLRLGLKLLELGCSWGLNLEFRVRLR